MEELHIQPSEIDALPFFEYEYTIEMYQEILEERKKNQEKGEQESSPQVEKYTKEANAYQRNASKYMRQPSMPKITMPKMPRF